MRWRARLTQHASDISSLPPWRQRGRLVQATGLVLEATGLHLPIGAPCEIGMRRDAGYLIEAQVVGFRGQNLCLMPMGDITGLRPGACVWPVETIGPHAGIDNAPARSTYLPRQLPVGDHLLGRVLDAAGRPLDALGDLPRASTAPLAALPLNPLQRAPVDSVLDVGVRAINGLLTVGRGQRIGLFAGSGVGKSVLLGMMARHAQADIIVAGLIGERGREVREFIETNLGPQGLRRAVVVAAPADVSPLLRLQGAVYATRIAEYFRDQGRHVLLIMDSLTRYAMAQREIGLARGEAPAARGYPPSVFARLPSLVERAGNGAAQSGQNAGSITAFYTVLTEGDDQQDPVADTARAILDGHIVLSRSLAESGHYPAIDIGASISRVMPGIAPPGQLAQADRFRALFARYQRNSDLISVGAYVPGSDPLVDHAIALYPRLEAYLRQDVCTACSYESAVSGLGQALGDEAGEAGCRPPESAP
jgi:flagellum-specific ATP synthase